MRNGMARLRHFSHRAFARMRRQKVAPAYLADEAVRLTAAGDGPDMRPVVSVDPVTNQVEITGHGLVTGDGPYRWETDGAPPGGIQAGEEYYIQVVDVDHVRLVTEKRTAVNGNPVDITSAGSGTTVAITRHVADAAAVLSWHDKRRAEFVSSVADADQL